MADDVLVNKAATVERCVPQSAKDVFELMARAQWIDAPLAEALKRMVAFRNIAVHDYQSLLMPILVSVITNHLHEFSDFTSTVLKRGSVPRWQRGWVWAEIKSQKRVHAGIFIRIGRSGRG